MADRMNLLEQSYNDLWPDDIGRYTFVVKHSGKFKGYNANIRRRASTITIGLSKQWRSVGSDIRKGLMQHLLVKLLKRDGHTMEMDLYNAFLKHVHIAVPKTKTHPVLADSFDRLNEVFFSGLLEKPNLELSEGVNTLGHYNYGADTLCITKHLLARPDLLDYVMYHEMLHKHHKFSSKNGRSCHHTKAFRDDERKFPEAERLEQEMSKFVTKVTRRRWFGLA